MFAPARSLLLGAVMPLLSSAGMLPYGPGGTPLSFPHFPNRLSAFLWRNWNLVPPSRLAAVLGTTEENVRRAAHLLGCGPEKGPYFGDRIALTVVRRNWHLLDYPQLLALLGWSEEKLLSSLREHDFLWIKLGRRKPRCGPLLFRPLSEEELKRAQWFRSAIEPQKALLKGVKCERRFAFLKDLNKLPEGGPKPLARSPFSIRLLHSYCAVFGDPLLEAAYDPYPEGYLARLSRLGVNAVWLHVVLSKLAPGRLFPEERSRSQVRLSHLRSLVKRAARYGIGVFLYFNEPRAQGERFFRKHPGLRGVREGDLCALCTSTKEVKDFLKSGAQHVFASVPGLAGLFTITASENLTNCYSHHGGRNCPRCRTRPAAEVIAEVNELLARGAWEANPKAEILVWDWGWSNAWTEAIVKRLPRGVRLMSVSEWSLPIERGGVRSTVGEYALSAVGPGPRALRNWEIARRYGLRTAAKVQVNNTWELSTVPFVPVPFTVGKHVCNLRKRNVSALMLSWSLGGYPSPNLRVVRELCAGELPDPAEAASRVACDRYGPEAAPQVCEAWRKFTAAFASYPFHIGVLYNGPQQLGPANLLYPEPTHYRATMTGFPYDDLDSWRAIYPPDVFARQFRILSVKWQEGLAALRTAVRGVPPSLRRNARGDLRVAEACGLHFQSVADQARFVMLRDQLLRSENTTKRTVLLKEIRSLIEREEQAARRLYLLSSQDSRLGFEAANQYFFLPQDCLEKITNCRYLREVVYGSH